MDSMGNLSITMESVVEDVLKQHGARLSDIDLASRRAEEAAARRYEAAAWLRRTVGVVGAKDLPEEPSEEEFRIGLRNGLILCNVTNKVQPGAIPKVVEVPVDSLAIPDGAPLSAYQYFENVRNFVVTLQDMGLPTFEASDLERGGKSSRVVDSVLALKSYYESKQAGRNDCSKFGGTARNGGAAKHFIRKGSDPFTNFISRTQSLPENSSDVLSGEDDLSGDLLIQSTEKKSSHSLSMLIRMALSDKKPEEVPHLVETLLNKAMHEFELRLASQKEMIDANGKASQRNEGVATIKEIATENELNESCVKQHEKDAEVREPEERLVIMEQQLKLESKTFQENILLCQNITKPMDRNNPKEIEEKVLKDLNENVQIERLGKLQAKELKQKALEERRTNQQLIFYAQQKKIQELKCALHSTKTGMESLKTQFSMEICSFGSQLRDLANATSGYHKILQENRTLYNQIQDLKGNIRVYCRVRPCLPGQVSSMCTLSCMDSQITIFSPLKTSKDARRTFSFNKVFGPSATQEEVFSDTQPLVRSVLDGYNVCIFAYGQTGSGKTHTMSGPKELNEKTIGVNYRALNDLFHLSNQRKDTFVYKISVQMVEIYNEQVRDLLSDGLTKKLEIRTCSSKGLSVPDANLVPVRSTEEVIEIMNLGQKNRAVCCTAINDRSSRSHSCLTIHVQGRDLTSSNTLRGCMHLVDLAGSERVDKSEVKGERLKEAQHINKSLSALGDVIASLAQKNSHVPYRNSKLTQLLQDSLGGHAKTLMFVHISPEIDAIGETLSTLKFAERVATVELGAAKINKDNNEVKSLKKQLAALKLELTRKGGGEPFRPRMSNSDLSRMKVEVGSLAYLNDEEDDVLSSTTDSPSMEEVSNNEINCNTTRQKEPNHYTENFQVSVSSPWSDEEDTELGAAEWVDKVVVNNRSKIPSEQDGTQQEQLLFQRYLNEMRVFPEQTENNCAGGKKGYHDSDSDDFENSTSDSSEVELLSHLNVSKIPAISDGSLSKLKKPQAKGTKSMDGRNLNHGNIPSPSRKLPNGQQPGAPNRAARQPPSGDGKRSGIKSNGK